MDTLAPLVGALIPLIGVFVWSLKEMQTRFYDHIDAQRLENAELRASQKKLTESVETLNDELKATQERESSERRAKELAETARLAAEQQARDSKNDADTVRLENIKLNKHILDTADAQENRDKETAAAQATMLQRIEALEKDGLKRDSDHTAALEAEIARRVQAENERDTVKAENVTLTQQIAEMRQEISAHKQQIDELKSEITAMRAASTTTPSPDSPPEPPT